VNYKPLQYPIPPRKSYIEALRGKTSTPRLRPFQREDVTFYRKHSYRVLNASAPGTGKTPTTLRAIYEAKAQLTPTLVICPSSVAWNWRREARVWAPGMSCTVVEGIRELPEPANITICPWDLAAPHLAELLQRGFQLIVADEAHAAKNAASQRGAATATLCASAPHVVLLTGTPLINNLEELNTLNRLLGTTDPPMVRHLIEDVAKDVPAKKRITLDVSIPPKAMAEYQRAEDEFGDYLNDVIRAQGEDGNVKAPPMSAQALVKVGYLRRILGRAKAMSAAAFIVRQIRAGEPVVVFAEHQDVLDTLATTLESAKVDYVRLDGGTNRKERQHAIDAFQAGDVPVFLGSQAAKEGITLHRARHALFVERWWTPAAEEQAEDRIRRIGQQYETFIWFMQVPGTYDERMSEIVESKRDLVSRTIGSHDIERQDATGLLGEWLRGQPAGETDLEMPEFPKLPQGTKVHAFLFPTKNWSVSNVRRWLHIHGYTARKVQASETTVRAELRSAAGYLPGTFRHVTLGPDMGAIVGVTRRIRKVVRNRNRRPKKRRMVI